MRLRRDKGFLVNLAYVLGQRGDTAGSVQARATRSERPDTLWRWRSSFPARSWRGAAADCVCAGWCDDWGQAYRDAIVVAPDYALAYYNLGTTLMGEERYAEAEVAAPPRTATRVAETGVAYGEGTRRVQLVRGEGRGVST